MKKVCVLGLGYIGLPTASILATHDHQVIGVDVQAAVVDRLRNGDVHIQEPGLKTMVKAGIHSGNLIVADKPAAADAFIITVPTPIEPDKKANLNYVRAAAEAVRPYLQKGNLVVLESTVPPGTTAGMFADILSQSGLDPYLDLHVVHSPERVLPGRILEELVSNDRVIGGLTPEATEIARDLYASFVQGEIFLTEATTAEMVKLMENTFRDVNIALANEFALMGESVGVNVWEAIQMANRHPRVNILSPGPGVGGHCIAVDPWFLVQAAPGPAQLIASARRMNDRMPEHVVDQVRALLSHIPQPKIAALGLAYKADVDDIRESPSLTVIRWLQATGCEVAAFDPFVDPDALNVAVPTLEEAVSGADCVLLLTNHTAFKKVDVPALSHLVRTKMLFDTRNCLPHSVWREVGFAVHLLGDGVYRNPAVSAVLPDEVTAVALA
ncbi:MAG: nucleotide sugar dehydrogenase [Chloroflexi bacterium]|nr:nucleotide sugar dehydrogenase [Chloroflexota bacterium]